MSVRAGASLIGFLGDPVAQGKVLEPLTLLLREQGLDAVVVPMRVARGELAPFVIAARALRNLAGLIVTVPHKQAVAPMANVLSPMAERCGAANVLRRTGTSGWEADLFDGTGFVAGLRQCGFDPAGKAASIAGAGGAGAAIAFALAQEGAGRLGIFDLDRGKASALVRRLHDAGADATIWNGEDADGEDLLVNATPAGMRQGDPLPMPVEALRPGLWVAEAVMQPETTPLLAEAALRGCVIHHGRHMMEGQLAPMAAFFAPAIAATAG